MKALIFEGPGRKTLKDRNIPVIDSATDAIVRMTKTTICGTDLHILKGDVPSCTPGRILGHEGVGVIEQVGACVTQFKKGDSVLISCISSCGKCEYCRRGMYSHCTTGGWILGNTIDGTQAEYVRIPHADTSLYPIPDGADEDALVMLSDILPTGFECGVLNGKVQPGGSVAIVGAGPVGLAALLTGRPAHEIPDTPIGASLLMMKTPTPEGFRSGRHFAAWIGLTPKDHSTAGKVRLGVITRAGDEALRSTLVVGATALLRRVRDGRGRNSSPWLLDLLKRKPPKLVAVALANKIARIAWKMMVTGEAYRTNAVPPSMACAA
ncbi:alcohol dehydrogenase catalytic domain-containing protein [Xanthobacter flavus]|uniref:alcohol dehydrogenase catalytic domain-containing protein n=1 Tax=Xanthobacter flavus TaxID=281 RepID=UPI003729BC74